MMDMTMRGLTAPQAVYALGRPDLTGDVRPGAALMGLVLEATRAGKFELPAAQRRPEATEVRIAPLGRHAPTPSPDYGFFDFDEDDAEMSL